MLRIAIVDPALGRTGAHNRGFATSLDADSMSGRRLGIWCNVAIEQPLCDQLADRGLIVDPVFDVDFYALTEKSGGISLHWDWIYSLAQQYLHAFDRIEERWPSGPVHVLHHSLAWEHASALALAVRLSTGRFDRMLHHAFLMYSPGVSESGQPWDNARQLDYRLAFKDLASLSGIRMYAGCEEFASAYAHLLGHPRPLPVHPCIVGDWRDKPASRRRRRIRSVLLYAGEIKKEKGFLDLPRRVTELLQRAGAEHRFVIQCVNPRNEAARGILRQLQAIAARDARVMVHPTWWSDAQLREAFEASDALCLDYDAAAYAHKTSGLLWLAAWYGLAVVVPRGTWLEREARRLGVPRLQDLAALAYGRPPEVVTHADPAYFRRLFTPLWQWFERECHVARHLEHERGPAVGRSDPESRAGANVVIFWKQNDSCLYGRHHDMVAKYLASRPDVRRVLVVDAPIGAANLARLQERDPAIDQGPRIHDLVRMKERGACDTGKIRYRVFVCPAGKYRFSDDGSGRPHFLQGYAAFLRDVFECEGVDPRRAVFWVFPRNFYMPHLLGEFTPARLVVDVEDDHRAWPGVSESLRLQLTRNYRTLLQQADMAFVNCASMQQAMREFCPGICLVPNGCDADPPLPAIPENPLFSRLESHRGSVIGYVGNLESKIDIPLLHEVAAQFQTALVVLAGSTHANPRVLELRKHPNILMPGVLPYAEAGAWISRFDVALVPHLNTPLTRTMHPQKLYTYLSWHVPVVATRTPNLEPVAGLVRVADGHPEFLREIRTVLEGPKVSRELFDAFIDANSWEARLSSHVDELCLGAL